MSEILSGDIVEIVINALIIIFPIIWDKLFIDYLKLPTRVLRLGPSQERDLGVFSTLLSYIASSVISILRSIVLMFTDIGMIWYSGSMLIVIFFAMIFLFYLLVAFLVYHEQNPDYFAYKHSVKFSRSRLLKTLVFILLLTPSILGLLSKSIL